MKRTGAGVAVLLLTAWGGTPGGPAVGHAQEDPHREARLRMVEEQIASRRWGEPVRDPAVLGAMRRVPRHRFVPPELARHAHADRPLPIGHGQTISQPYIVALMTQLLRLRSGDKALEVGTGSGYQAAVLAEITDHVFSIEIVEPLARGAKQRLGALGYGSVRVRHGDGYWGWPEEAPFDAVIVTAAATHIPPPLLEQLRPGGRMVIPVGAPFQTQALMLVEKREDGSLVQRSLGPVRFVPLTRRE